MIARSLLLQKKVYVPRINKSVKKIEICQIKSLGVEMAINSFGIREPVHAALQTPEKIDAVVELSKSSLLVGLAYSFQIIDSLHQDFWDQKVQRVVTEKNTLNG